MPLAETPSVALDQLRLAAALAHSAPDADMEVAGTGRRWLVSYHRPRATIDPCGFRRLVLATIGGCRVGIQPVERLAFVGALRDIGGGVFQRHSEHGTERRVATFLPASHVETLLGADVHDADTMTAHVRADHDLGVTVVTLAADHPVFDHRLDVVALDLAATFLVGEIIDDPVLRGFDGQFWP